MDIGVTQGDLVPSTVFDIVMHAVVREVLMDVCGPQEAHHGLGWAEGYQSIVLYLDDGCISGYNPIWV